MVGNRTIDAQDFLKKYLTFELSKKVAEKHADLPQNIIDEAVRTTTERYVERWTYWQISERLSELCTQGKIYSIQAKPIWTIKTLPCIWLPLNCIIWFAFWWFVVYKGVILYVAYGRHVKESGP